MAKPSVRASEGIQPAAMSIADFCAAHGIAISTFYALPEADRPAMIRLGAKRILITVQAVEEWRRRMEARATGGAR
jgi:hypothetical protein